MADESRRPTRDWLLEPVGLNEVRVHVDVGEGVEVSPELREVLDALLDEIYAAEVQGLAAEDPDRPQCSDLMRCSAYSCDLGRCQPLDRFPCAWKIGCTIQPTFRS
jgi:hypothetical protein